MNPQVSALLDTLFADAAQNDPLVRQAIQQSGVKPATEADHYRALRQAYLPVTRDFGNLLHALVRSMRAQTVVEFGTSFGISTIFLASAIQANGSGRVITTEFDPEKAERARKNLASVGLDSWVDIRVGDALDTLRADLPAQVDLILLDGAKGMYLDVLRLLEPQLRGGGIVASDNTDHDGMEPFLEYLRDPSHGYTTAALLTETDRGHEISVRD